MADDVTLPGTNSVVKTIEKTGGKHVQLMALDIGATTTSTPVVAGQGLMAASVPVAIASNQSAVPTSDSGITWTQSNGVSGAAVTSANASAADLELSAAPTSGQKVVIDDILFSTDTAMSVDFKEETTGTVIFRGYFPSSPGISQITPRGRVKLATANKKLVLRTSVAGNIACTVLWHSEA